MGFGGVVVGRRSVLYVHFRYFSISLFIVSEQQNKRHIDEDLNLVPL